ncbi:coth protein-domain-containing protein [Mycotypha africana]|uniref:coth protein-domain-containing protein n=1 Tax=Mycotypha africana TaxID=64632 RepID=UPI00230095AE|nr:coth protein-domain-containing protein [Mycotypha africana]KAI8984158.1 coth protein-domain-containing protein [Mycotypha africana]
MGAIIDDKLYPLKITSEKSTLLHSGKAPIANHGYKYAILDDSDNIVQMENFTRQPLNEDTQNEYYNRTWTSVFLPELPTVLDPLPIINRIDSDLHIDGEIPTVHITGNQTALDYIHSHANDDIDVPGLHMTYISPNKVKVFKNITLSISGHSSRNEEKLSYKIKLLKEDDLSDYRRFKFRSLATDPSYMREHVAYSVGRSAGLPITGFSYLRLYLNDRPIGLFGLAEDYKNPWQRNEFAGGDKGYKQGAFYVANLNGNMKLVAPPFNGNTTEGKDGSFDFPPLGEQGPSNPSHHGGFKGFRHDKSNLHYVGENATLYRDYYDLKENPSVGTANYTKIIELTKFIAQQPNITDADNSVTSQWEQYIDVDSALRMIALEIVISNSDSYMAMGNNYIIYEDPDADRLMFSAQDFDLTMGHGMHNATLMYGGNWTAFPGFLDSPLTATLYHVPKYRKKLENLIHTMTAGIMNSKVLNPRIDALYKMLKEDVDWDKTLPRVNAVPTNETSRRRHFSMGNTSMTFDEAVNGNANRANTLGLKEFVKTRSRNLLEFFNSSKA